jgi:putative salt-induced outer membrane protein YdiY
MILGLCLCIAGHALAQPAVIDMTTGERVIGTIIDQNQEVYIVEHATFGRLVVPRTQVKSVVESTTAQPTPAPQAAAQPLPATEPPQPPAPVQPEPRVRLIPQWDSQFEAGFNAQSGNSEELDIRLAFTTEHETQADRWKADARYYRAQSDGDLTDNEFTAGLMKEWLLPESKWLYYAKGRYDYDEFEAWDHRISAGGGLGYEWIDSDKLDVTLFAGAGAVKEFGSDDDELRPEGQLGIEVDWKLFDNQSLLGSNWFYPDLGDLGEFRNVSSVAWSVELDRMRGLSFKLGLENEYESEVDPDTEHNDLRVFGAMVLDF